MKNRPVQYFTDEYLLRTKNLSKDEIADFLESFRALGEAKVVRRRLISLRVPEDVLAAFKAKAKFEGVRYQTRLVELMRAAITAGR